MIDKSIFITILCLIVGCILTALLPKGDLKANLIFFGVIVGVVMISGWLVLYGLKGVYEYLSNR